MMKKIKFLWDCAEPSERLQAFAYVAVFSFAIGFIVKTLTEWLS